jgi:brefeldin A-inhibited guanine nucleotide-exchange protein
LTTESFSLTYEIDDHYNVVEYAGLSELTFDPRPDIRKSALEVLFDTLRFHGHMFSPGLWEKVFDSVLFPIFDYVRRATEPAARKQEASSEKQAELEMDAWLYETCTLALQLVVDLFVKFYPVVSPLLGRILSLLTGFIKRPHQSLAAIGVAAFVRLMSNAGNLLSDEKWLEVLTAFHEAAFETLPDLEDLVASAEEEQTSHKPVSSHDNPEHPEKTDALVLHLLLTAVKCRIAVQLLLVQAMTEIYNSHGSQLSVANTMLLLDTLHAVAGHAHKVNGDHALRQKLQELQLMPDPPLLRLESEAYQAYLNMLQHLPLDKPTLAKDVDVETRLVELCEEVLRLYVSTSTASVVPIQKARWVVPLGSARRRELVARAPLVVATLQAVSGLRDASFERYLVRFFPLLAGLISCEHGSGEVQVALSDMFSNWIGPILLQT